jgi:NitT/TauT family transport system permease protein
MISRGRLFLYRVIFGVVLLAFWELSSGRLIDPFWVSSPSRVFAYLYEVIADGSIFSHLAITLYETFAGFFIGAIFGIGLGFVLGRREVLADILDPYVVAFNGIPRIALAPLFIIWFGIGINSKIAMVASFTTFLVFVNTFFAIRSINEHFVNLARLMGASNVTLLRRILFPSAAPGIMLGLRTSIPYGMIGAVVGEFMASNRGLGFLIYSKSQLFDAAGMFAAIVVLVIVVVSLTQLMERLERRVARWVRVEETRVAL